LDVGRTRYGFCSEDVKVVRKRADVVFETNKKVAFCDPYDEPLLVTGHRLPNKAVDIR